MKKQSELSRLMEYAGNYRFLTYLSWILSAVSALLAALPFAEEQSVPYSRFLACLLQCAGVADYSTFTVNGAKTALRINSGTIPVLGTVDVTTY